jgi:purine-nucleoside phosphorylase
MSKSVEVLTPGAAKIADCFKSFGVARPSFHVVLGSGFKDALQSGLPSGFGIKGEIEFQDVPGLFPSTAPGHSGKYVVIEHERSKKTGIIQVGRLHGYEGLEPREVVRTVMFTRELGVEHYYITNAAGGLAAGHRPGDVMIIEDQINLTGKNPLCGPNPKKSNGEEWGPRFLDVAQLFHREKNKKLKEELLSEGLKVHQGVYIGVLGPVFETPAEIRFYIQVGAQAVGMSTVWETVALKHAGAKVSAISLISNLGSGLELDQNGNPIELDHFAILDACKTSSVGILKAILKVAQI